jgi:small subunit ribosomal protein S20
LIINLYSLLRQFNNKGTQEMPIIKSAKKRVKVSAKAAVRNSKTKRTLKGALKAFHRAVTGGKKETKELQGKAQSALDTAAKKGVMHKNKVARKKSQVAKAAKAAAGATKAVTKKAPVKKAVVPKKVATKKPVAKKAPAKKPTAKKK